MSHTPSNVLTTSASAPAFFKASCTDCHLKGLCLPIAMDVRHIDQLDSIIQRHRPIQAGEHLYHAGDTFRAIYAIRSGSVKSYLLSGDGEEQVNGFYLAGEVLGFDGMADGSHQNHVVALETTAVCEIPFEHLEALSREIPELQRHFFRLMGRRIDACQDMMLTLGKKSAESRIATLLLSLSERFARRKLSTSAMRLPMSRQDIGNFLGLTIETVSRTFTRLHKDGIIGVDGREITLRDRERLQALCQQPR